MSHQACFPMHGLRVTSILYLCTYILIYVFLIFPLTWSFSSEIAGIWSSVYAEFEIFRNIVSICHFERVF